MKVYRVELKLRPAKEYDGEAHLEIALAHYLAEKPELGLKSIQVKEVEESGESVEDQLKLAAITLRR